MNKNFPKHSDLFQYKMNSVINAELRAMCKIKLDFFRVWFLISFGSRFVSFLDGLVFDVFIQVLVRACDQ